MDLLLIDPPRQYWGYAGGAGFFSPPVGLVSLAGFLEQNGVQVEILDCNVAGKGWDALAEEIRRRNPGCIGVSSSMTCFVPEAFRCLEMAKQISPHIHTIGGGLQFTLTPDEAFRRCASLDCIVRGDGEYTTLELLQQLEQGNPDLSQVAGLSFRTADQIVHNKDRPPLMDLDSLPFPAWHLLPVSHYALPMLPPRWGNYSVVVTSKSCPFQCTFCSPKVGQAPYREMSAARVLEMLDELYYRHETRVFWFSDLSFNANRARTEQILDGIIKRRWKVHLVLDGTRTDLILRDQDLLPKMRKAGVVLVCLGVESPFEEDLRNYQKGTSLQIAGEAVALVKRNGIHPWCFFMLGHPRHTEQDILRMLQYAKELDPTIAIFTLVTPVPGTAFYDELASQGLIADQDWAHYDLGYPVIQTPNLSRRRLMELLFYCYESYYKRPSKIIRHGILGDDFSRYTYRSLRFLAQKSSHQLHAAELELK